MQAKFIQLGSLLLVSALFIGCASGVDLKHSNLGLALAAKGKIRISSIKDSREEDKSESFRRIGTIRGGFGIPQPVHTKDGFELDVALKELVTNALTTAGYNSSGDNPDSLPSIEIDVLNFWCDGYAGYKITSKIKLTLVSTDKSILIEKIIARDNGFTTIVGLGPMHSAYKRLIDELAQDAAIFFKSDEFSAAYKKK